MHDEETIEAVRWRGVTELRKARDAAEAAYSRARELHERAEKAIREENRRDVGEWARDVLEDEQGVILALGTTGLHDPVDIVEVVALSTAGETVFSERVRPAAYQDETITGYDDAGDPQIERREAGPVEVEDGAARMHGHTAETLAEAPTFEELYSRLREVLGDKRVVVYNEEYLKRVLSQTYSRYGLEPLPVNIECAMTAYSRVEGQWSVAEETYYSVKLPNGDGMPGGNARATLELLRSLAGEGGAVPGGSVEDHDMDEEDFDDIAFRAQFPYRVRYPLVF